MQATTIDKKEDTMKSNEPISPTQWVIAGFLALFLLVGFCMFAWAGFGAIGRWSRERDMNTNRKDIVIEAEAQAAAAEARTESEVAQAERQAEADRIRAQGNYDANVILQESLTDEYLQWYWITTMKDSGAALIYVPTGEDGLPTLPITEAGRAVEDVQPAE